MYDSYTTISGAGHSAAHHHVFHSHAEVMAGARAFNELHKDFIDLEEANPGSGQAHLVIHNVTYDSADWSLFFSGSFTFGHCDLAALPQAKTLIGNHLAKVQKHLVP